MKKLLKSLMLFAAAAMALTSCENEAMNEGIEANDTVTMTFVAGAPESKTAVSISGDKAKYTWSAGDKVGFYYVDVEGTDSKKKNSSEAVPGENNTATFTASFDKIDNASAYNVGAFYPGESWVNHAEEKPFNNVKVKINAGQSLTEDTFDPKADLMIAYPFMGIELTSDNTKTLNFHRIAAIGKMNLKLEGMESDEVIKSVKFSLAEGTHFNGPVSLDMQNSTYTLGTEDTSNAVTLTGELAANAERTAIFFTCFPGEYSGAYTIEVKTDKATYKKEATLSKALSFTEGNVLNFNATVGGREAEVVEEGSTVDVLDREFTGATKNNTSYSSWSGKTGKSGAVYAGNSAGGNDAIQLRSNNSTSGIVTTTSGGTVKKVAVTWNSNTDTSRVLSVYGKNSAYTAATELYSSTTQGTLIGEITNANTSIEIEGDYEYIGLRSNSGAMYLTEIQITWAGAGQGGETPVVKADRNLAWSAATATATVGEAFTAPTLSGTTDGVTYSSSDTSVATINADGIVTIKAAGTTTIKAEADETETLNADEASYTLTVSAAQGGEGGEGGEVVSTVTLVPSDFSLNNKELVAAKGGVNVVVNKNTSNSDPVENNDAIRFYKSHKMTFTSSKDIVKIVFNYNDGKEYNDLTVATGSGTFTRSNATGTYTSTGEKEIAFVAEVAQVRFNSIEITFAGGEGGSTEPEEPETPVVKADRNLAWSAATATATVGEAFTAPTLSGTTDGVTYSSSDTGVATIDADGIVTIIAAGTTTIKAEADETETLNADEASYTLTVSAAQSGGGEDLSVTQTLSCLFSNNSTSGWTNSYGAHTFTYDVATIKFSAASKQTGTITTMPVTKNGTVDVAMTNGEKITSVTYKCKQWGSKTQTMKLYYSTNGTTFTEYTTNVTWSNYELTCTSLPEGTVAVRAKGTSSSNQIGIESVTITY
ncbi:MAG: Ig-like domain-containing protein [Tidjanibacter sp.]|nr:Ig-like domain-containing protein [Tidjanibacter sp.]